MPNKMTRAEHAQALYDHIKILGESQGRSVMDFCKHMRLPYNTINGWSHAKSDPRISTLVEVSEALDLSLGQLLVIGGYGTPEELMGAVPPAVPARISVDEAINSDGSLDLDQKRVLKEFTAFIRAGGEARVTVRNRRGKRG